MFISEQYDFEWNSAYEKAFYSNETINRICDCAFTWDAL